MADSPRTPWRNGAGWTRPLAQWPAGADLDELAWRVSCAEIAVDAPFSSFPGMQRQLMLVSGGTLTLVVDGERAIVEVGQSFSFSGDAQVSCQVAGPLPAVALNVMTRPGAATASVAVKQVAPGLALVAPDDGDLVAVTLTAQTLVGGEHAPLDRHEAVWLAAGERGTVGGSGRVAVIRLRSASDPRVRTP